MTIDDDDDAVVPSGSRRSSYVPPAEENAGDPIDIPRIVVSGDIPEAYSSSDSVPDLQQRVSDDVDTGEIPLPAEEPVLPELSIPTRQSLTPEELSQALDPAAGLSSSDQMALLDSQIALREADANAASRFLDEAREAGTPEAAAMFDVAKTLFADVAPELVSVRITPAQPLSVAHDIEIVSEESTEAAVEDTEIPSTTPAPDESGSEASRNADDIEFLERLVDSDNAEGSPAPEWALAVPATTASQGVEKVTRRHLTTVAAFASVALTTLILCFSAGLDPQMLIGITAASLVIASGFVFGARSFTARTGSTFREVIDSLTGRTVGRTLLVIAALGGLSAFTTSIVGFMQGAQDNEVTAGFVSRLSDIVGPVPPIATAALLGLALALSTLPLRALRAFLLTGIGFTVIAAGSVVGMSGFLVAASEKWELPSLQSILSSGGYTMALVIATGGLAFASIHSLSRESAGIRNGVWLGVGAGLGFLAAAATIALALISPESEHYFFANNSLVHVVSSSGTLAVLLGALVSGVALVTTATLVVRGALMLTVNDDRSEPSVWWKLSAVALVGAVVALMFVGVDDSGTVVVMPDWADSIAPSVQLSSIGFAIVLGLALARSLRPSYRATRARRVVLSLVVLAMGTLALGYSAADGVIWGWVGFINGPLTELGYGVVLEDVLVPPLVAVATALVSLLAMIQRAPRAIDSSSQE